MESVVLAEKPKRPLPSRWSDVRSNSSGESCDEGFDSSVTVPRLAEAGLDDCIGVGLLPQPVVLALGIVVRLLELRIEPAAFVDAGLRREARPHFPVVARHERLDLAFALDHHCERRRLHATHGRQIEAAALGIEGGHRARAVDADDPVGLRAAARGARERRHVLVGAQVREAVSNRSGCHRLQPQPLDRLPGARGLRDVAEDQLALAPGVARIDQLGDVLALDQARQQLQAILALRDRDAGRSAAESPAGD